VQLKILDPALTKLLLKDEEDILTPRAAQRDAAISAAPCPRCKGELRRSLNPQHVFTPEEPLARILAECGECGFCYDPHSGLILSTGNPSMGDDLYGIYPEES